MSDICVVNKKVEVKFVEVPDYKPVLEEIKIIQKNYDDALTASSKTVEINGNSILEQIGAYLYELYKPILQRDKTIPTYLSYFNFSWKLRKTRDTYEGTYYINNHGSAIYYYDSLELTASRNGTFVQLLVTPTTYHIKTDIKNIEDYEILLDELIRSWPDFKYRCIKELTNYCDLRFEKVNEKIQQHNDCLQHINDFKL